MSSRVGKIVASFTKTVSKLRAEADRLDGIATRASVEQVRQAQIAQDCDLESDRAIAIANKLEGLLNG